MVVVVGVNVVPDDRLPLDDLGQRAALLGGDGLRDHHGPGPEHADGGVQPPPDRPQVLGLAHARHGARRAVLHRAEQQRRPLQRRVQLVAHLAVKRGVKNSRISLTALPGSARQRKT